MMFYAMMWSVLSDRKDFESNKHVSKYKLYRWMMRLHPSVMEAYVKICKAIVKVMGVRLVPVDRTFMRRNGNKLPFVRKEYDPMLKREALGQ